MALQNNINIPNIKLILFERVKRKMDFLTLIGSEITLRKVAMTHGGEYAGACPFCGGNDRFRVWPEEDGGRYWCRNCGKAGDSIQWLRERRGLSFVEACQYLGQEPSPRAPRPARPAWEPREAKAPADLWQEKAKSFMDKSIQNLWADTGKDTRAFLNDRGLTDETIQGAGLGWNPADIYLDREAWGLPEALKEDGTLKKLWIPAGLVIPLIDEGRVVRLRIRRTDGEPRYILIPGSDTRPMTWNLERGAAVIVESELDGILLNQEAGDLAGFVAMGTATGRPDRKTHDALTGKELILVALDTDEAGAKASWKFWPDTYGEKAKRWPCVNGKDPSEAKQNGLNIRAWILAGLPDRAGTLEGILRQSIKEIEAGGKWKATAEVRKIEDRIDRVYLDVLDGKETIEAFRALCLEWKNAGTG